MNIIRWCNENNGFLTAILSLIGLVLSVTAIVVSIRTARLPYKKKLMLGSYMSVGTSMIPGVGTETQILGMSASATNVGNRTINITYLGYAIKKDGRYNMIYISGTTSSLSSSYTLVWTSLCEKRILTPPFGKWDLPPKAIHMSSVYYLKDGKITKASETLFEDRLYY